MPAGRLPPEMAFLPDGRHRIVCPKCHGGSTKEKSLAIEVSGNNAMWYCFRAGCEYQGGVGGRVVDRCGKTALIKAKDEDKAGYVRYPIYDNDMACRGWEYRSEGVATPKSLLNTDSDWVNLYFPSHISSPTVLLVEDRRSAIAMNPYYPTVALMGVHLSEAKVAYMRSQGITRGVVALDNDATAQAIKMKRNNSFICGIMVLMRDLKDERIVKLLEIAGELYE